MGVGLVAILNVEHCEGLCVVPRQLKKPLELHVSLVKICNLASVLSFYPVAILSKLLNVT